MLVNEEADVGVLLVTRAQPSVAESTGGVYITVDKAAASAADEST